MDNLKPETVASNDLSLLQLTVILETQIIQFQLSFWQHLRWNQSLALLIALHQFARPCTDTSDGNNEHGIGMALNLVESELKLPSALDAKPSLGGARRRMQAERTT